MIRKEVDDVLGGEGADLSGGFTDLGVEDGLDIEEIGERLYGTFSSLPKHNTEFLDGSSTRYLAHSFFIKEFGWLIRGLDPNRKLPPVKSHSGNSTKTKVEIPRISEE